MIPPVAESLPKSLREFSGELLIISVDEIDIPEYVLSFVRLEMERSFDAAHNLGIFYSRHHSELIYPYSGDGVRHNSGRARVTPRETLALLSAIHDSLVADLFCFPYLRLADSAFRRANCSIEHLCLMGRRKVDIFNLAIVAN